MSLISNSEPSPHCSFCAQGTGFSQQHNALLDRIRRVLTHHQQGRGVSAYLAKNTLSEEVIRIPFSSDELEFWKSTDAKGIKAFQHHAMGEATSKHEHILRLLAFEEEPVITQQIQEINRVVAWGTLGIALHSLENPTTCCWNQESLSRVITSYPRSVWETSIFSDDEHYRMVVYRAEVTDAIWKRVHPYINWFPAKEGGESRVLPVTPSPSSSSWWVNVTSLLSYCFSGTSNPK